MKIALLLLPLLLWASVVQGTVQAEELSACRALYSAVVFDDAVDYERLAHRPERAACARALAEAHPPTQGAAALAFWVDAYNLLTLLAIADDPARWSAQQDGHALFRDRVFTVANTKRTLDEIEREEIARLTKDPRVEFLLSCGSRSCALLPPEVMAQVAGSPEANPENREGNRKDFDGAMADGMRRWFAKPENLRVNRKDGVVEIGQLLQLDWHGGDFERAGILLVTMVADALSSKDPTAAADLRAGKLTLRIRPYDWRVNRVRRIYILP